jgi:Toprim-like
MGGPDSAQIVAALANDPSFEFKESGQYLNKGICPECGKREVFVSKSQPWRLQCNRQNRCTWSESTRAVYPHLFNRYTERHPATSENPKATADAYLAHNRGFDLGVIGDWYTQERYRIPGTGKVAETVRFYLDPEKTRYWERLIDHQKDDGQRINFGGRRKEDGTLVKGDWWMPPGQTIDAGDAVYLVEGIFHAIALHLAGYKACALLMAGNFPEHSIEPYGGRAVRWRLALDDDKAGRENMLRHRRKLLDLGERVEIVLTGTSRDWDDLYRLDLIDDDFLGEALWRGRMFAATKVTQKAWAYYAWKGYSRAVIDFGNRLFSVQVDDKLKNELADHGMQITDLDAMELFSAHTTIVPISNCYPKFLYCEQYTLTGEISYFFQVDFNNNSPSVQISLPGDGIDSAAAFNKSLSKRAAGATFDGASEHYRLVRQRWFRRKILHIETVPYVGYDRNSETYLFQSWAVHKGKELKLNEHGFFAAGKKSIKTGFRGFVIERGNDEFKTDWFEDFLQVFSWNGLVCLSFWFGTFFAEQIRAELKSFPFLEITGQHGTGKSTLLEFLWKLSGREEHEGFDPSKATFAARARSFMQVSNLPIVLIESDREAPGAKQKQFDFEELKTAYNGRAIRSLGVFNRGNDVEEPPFRGSIVISQNAAVDGSPALLSRIIQCRFTTEHFKIGSEQLAARFELAETPKFAGFMPACLKLEEQILDHFRQVYPEYLAKFAAIEEIKDLRVRKTHATLMACASSLRLVIPEFTQRWLDCLLDFVVDRAISRQGSLNQDHPVVQSFWETYELIHERDIGQSAMGQPPRQELLNHSPHAGEIWINLTQFYQCCLENKVETIPKADMKKYLPSSTTRKYAGQKNCWSKLLNRSIWCWIFTDIGGS